MIFHVFRLLSRISEGDGSISSSDLFAHYTMEMLDGSCTSPCSQRELAECVLSVFPQVIKKKKKHADGTVSTIYHGIYILPLEPLDSDRPTDLSLLAGLVPAPFKVEVGTDCVVCTLETDYAIKGSPICKILTFQKDNIFTVSVCEQNVGLKANGISNKYTVNKVAVENISNTVSRMKLCQGVKVTQSVICSRFHTLDVMKCTVTGEATRVLRSILCKWVLKFNAKTESCITCQRMTFKTTSTNKENQQASGEKYGPKPVCKYDIKRLIPNAPDQMIDLL